MEHSSAWKVSDFHSQDDYTYTFTDGDLVELDGVIETVLSGGKDLKDVTKQDAPLPSLGPKLVAIQEEVTWGRGFALLRGLPVWRYTRRESLAAYWVLGLYWGKAGSNNQHGHLIGHIKDVRADPSLPTTRLYATHEAQPWHNDVADLVSLLCLHNAKEGGHSSWASSVSVHNEIVRRRPDLARVLADPVWFYDRKGEVPPGKAPYFLIPVFNYHAGHLFVNFSSNYYHASQRHPEVPRLTAPQLEAIALFEGLAASEELAMHYILQPGDIQLLNNHTCLHHRTAFQDWADPARKRHLLRLWLSPAHERELPPVYADLYGGSLDVGNRGAIRVEGTREHIPEHAEDP